jgi:hypothetical protein
MQSEPFLEFLARQGHRIVETESWYWYDAQPRFYFYYPYHRLITPSSNELKRLFWGESCIGVRYFTPMEYIGKESYMIVCTDKSYDFSSLDKHSARRETRKGLENFEIRQMEFKELASKGNSLNYDTSIRQGRDPRIYEGKKWQLYCSSADGLKGFEAWGAFSGKNLASFMVTFMAGDHFTIWHHSSATAYLPLYPNNALVYYVTKLKLAEPEVRAVSYGPQSLDAPESLDKFKFRMGFQKKPLKQVIVFNPLVRPFINKYSHKIIQRISTLRPENDTLRKLEGIMWFYREAT